MGNWEKVMRAKARCGNFVGRGAKDEDAYFEFFADYDIVRYHHLAFAAAKPAMLTFLSAFRKVFPGRSAVKLFQQLRGARSH